MKKRRILIANDAHWLGTGYGVYGEALLSRLQNTGRYEIAEIACYAAKPKENTSWTVFPNVPDSQDKESSKRYSSNMTFAFGAYSFPYACAQFKPDIVFDMRDYWMYSFQEVSMLRPFFKWVVMPTVDSAPQKPEWLDTFANMDLVIPYTEWAKATLENQCGDNINLFPDIANAGVDLDVFVPPDSKTQAKEKLFGRGDLEISGCVMRNQKRKLIPDILKAYRKYLDNLKDQGKNEQYEKSFLYLHTSYPESMGWDIPALLLEHGMLNKTYFTSKCHNCNNVTASRFHESPSTCKKCGKKACTLPNAGNSISTPDLVKVYQTFDLFLQVAICEGFGMPQAEAASCGIPIASVDYSAMSEIVRKLEGYPIKVSHLFRELETGADRANPDIASIVEIISSYFSLSEEERQNKSTKSRELCKKYYSWDGVADVWDRALTSVSLEGNLPWDAPERKVNNALRVPGNMSEVETIKFIVDNVLQEPFLWNTAPIRKLVHGLTNGWQLGSNKNPTTVTLQSAVQQLENLAKQKIDIDNIRRQYG